MKKTIIILAIVVVQYSCSTKQAVQKQPEPVVTESTESDIVMRGKSLYENNCAKCHELPKTNAYTTEKWVGILKWMQPKANISDQEREDIHFYLSRSL